MKGFDYLAPQGFYDAIDAYGFPSSIIELDKAAQSNTTVHVRTARGVTGPITVDGLTRQGEPLSPLKSTMTTSLGHRYLDDLAMNDDSLTEHSSLDRRRIKTAILTCPRIGWNSRSP